MARKYTRDARGRFASGGFSGQTGGRGARLMSAGRSRAGGGAKIQATAPSGTFRRGQGRKASETTASRAGRIQGPKLQGVTRARLSGRQMSEGAGLRGKRRQERQQRMAIMRQMLGRTTVSRAEPLTTGRGTLAARASLRRSRANLAANPSPAQRGAVTRANRYARQAKASNRQVLGASPAGRFVRGKGRTGGPASNIRPTNRYPRKPLIGDPATAKNGIRRTGRNTARLAAERQSQAYARRLGRATSNYQAAQQARAAGGDAKAMARAKRSERVARRARDTYRQPKSVVKPYRPATLGGQFDKIDRQINRELKSTVDELKAISDQAKKVRARMDPMRRRWERSNAKAIADRRKKGIDGEIARAELGTVGGTAGRKAISRRMNRALDAAARGSKPAKRAVSVYLDQLAGMGPGKPSRGRNNLRPGPRNTKGTPKRRRKRKG